ncbi:ABC transporter permease [Paenibacillus cymbidii]|uniref:ABC transporter permease n=1 Tax=Paenibacillus cymbidii TaxID=1639034 RepID=UPI001F387B88|nr:ABC transporter permease subunit [Paenibacillus cymbidii]
MPKTIRKIIVDRYMYVLLLPVLLNFIIFHYIPMWGLQIAFKDLDIIKGIAASPWVGFKHFNEFFHSYYFWQLIRNTLLINVYLLVFGFPAPIILALLLNEIKNKLFTKTIQTVVFLPYFISIVVVVGMIKNMLSPESGIVNVLITSFGGEPIAFLTEPKWFRAIYTMMDIWQSTGFTAIIYIAAIMGIDSDIYEAAEIDGAGRFGQMWHVTLPGIKQTIILLLILKLGNILNVGWQEIILLSNSLTAEVADVIQTYVYFKGLLNADYSFATAVGAFQSAIGFIVIVIANRLAKKYSDTYLW